MSKLPLGKLHGKLMHYLDNLVAKHGSSRVQSFWHYNAGPRTIFFWAPLVKWGLVIAGLHDLDRPIETISFAQPLSLACSGAIWSRNSVVIYPVNYSLLGANACVFFLNIYVVVRVVHFNFILTEEEQELVIQKRMEESEE